MAIDGDFGIVVTFLLLKCGGSSLIFYSALRKTGNNNKSINVHIKMVRKN